MTYLYLGGEAAVRSDEIIGIFDLDKTSCSRITRDFLSAAEQRSLVVNAAEDIPKSFVVTAARSVILTQPNTPVLARRLTTEERKQNTAD